jgi:CBS domain-containing protein
MSRTVHTAESSSKVGEAVKLMAKRNIGSIIVKDRGNPTAIITERDVVRILAHLGSGSVRRSLKSVASKPLVTVSPTTEIWEAFAIMLRKGIRRLPVLEKGRVVGILTERDLLKWVVKVFYEPNIPPDIKELVTQNP